MPGGRSECTGTAPLRRADGDARDSVGRRPAAHRLDVPSPEIDPAEATRELARRYLHVFGPGTSKGFDRWASIDARKAAAVFDDLGKSSSGCDTVRRRVDARSGRGHRPGACGAARAVPIPPSGDAYTLGVTSEDRALLLPDEAQRRELWTPRVWPGALLVAGKVVGTWRRAAGT